MDFGEQVSNNLCSVGEDGGAHDAWVDEGHVLSLVEEEDHWDHYWSKEEIAVDDTLKW